MTSALAYTTHYHTKLGSGYNVILWEIPKIFPLLTVWLRMKFNYMYSWLVYIKYGRT